jgi:plasmid maintenance system antidote protein VapI
LKSLAVKGHLKEKAFMVMDIRRILKRELEKRQKINPRYSLRGFAKNLQISPSFLSEIIAKKRTMTLSMLSKISRRLNFTEAQIKKLKHGLKKTKREGWRRRRTFRQVKISEKN